MIKLAKCSSAVAYPVLYIAFELCKCLFILRNRENRVIAETGRPVGLFSNDTTALPFCKACITCRSCKGYYTYKPCTPFLRRRTLEQLHEFCDIISVRCALSC